MGFRSGTMDELVMLNAQFWKGRRVLVTGHTGFKGSWLILWLLSLGAEVSGVALEHDNSQNLFFSLGFGDKIPSDFAGELHHRICNICDLSQLKHVVEHIQPQVVIHLAAQSLVQRSYKEPLLTWATNVQGSLNLLESLKYLQGFVL